LRIAADTIGLAFYLTVMGSLDLLDSAPVASPLASRTDRHLPDSVSA